MKNHFGKITKIIKKLAVLSVCFAVCFMSPACNIQSGAGNIDMTPRLISSTQILTSSEIAKEVRSAIVGISCDLTYGTSIGSGVCIASGGYILTNAHVVENAKYVTVYFADQTKGKAKVLWQDDSVDLAIIQTAKNLPYLDTCDLSNVSVGEDVLAIGTPISLQFQHSVTKGIVSALNRTLEINDLSGYTTYMQNLIQHDASINAGNSGGPLINSKGQIVGINSLKASDAEGIGFAIPIETAMIVAKKIIPNENFEKVYLGIFGCDAEIASYKELTTRNKGVYVISIAEDSPLKLCNMENGDIITQINGKTINNMLDFRRALYDLEKNNNINITYSHNETEHFVIAKV